MIKDSTDDFIRDSLLPIQPFRISKKQILSVLTALALVGTMFALVGTSNNISFLSNTELDQDPQTALVSLDPRQTIEGQLSIYQDFGYEGRSWSTSTFGNVNLIGSLNFNDMTSSFKVGKGLRVRFYRNGLEGGPDNYFEVVGPFSESSLGVNWNDQITTIQIFEHKEPRVSVFAEADLSLGSTGTFTEGSYTTEGILGSFNCRNCISALIIPNGLEVAIYTQDYFQGNPTVLTAGEYNLAGKSVAEGKLNDRLASMEITKQGKTVVRGSWVKVASSNDALAYDIEVGFSEGTTKETSSTFGTSISQSLEVGSEAVGFKSVTTVEISSSVSRSVASSIAKASGVTITATCTNTNFDQLSLWQWQMTGIRGGQQITTLNDSHYLCRRQQDASSPPKCIVGFCADGPCNTCKANGQIA